jgi:hypothetical protein
LPNKSSLKSVFPSIIVNGKVVKTENAKQPFEIHADSVEIFNLADADYPLQKKRHSFEYLRTVAHLRPRTNTFNAVFRIRSVAAFAIHEYFQNNGYVYVNTPIITCADCEGSAEMFKLTTLDLDKPLPQKDGKTDFSEDLFGKKAYITGSGQLHGETFAEAYGKIYTFGPTLRSENSNTKTHANEFWMIEPEIAFCDLEQLMDIEEDCLKFVVSRVLEKCPEEMEFCNNFIEKGLIDKLHKLVNSKFVRIDHKEAIDILKKADKEWEFKPEYGEDLGFYKLRWAFDVAIAFIYNTFGFAGIYAFVVIIASLTVLSLFNILLKQKNNIVLSFIATVISMLLMTSNWSFTARGQIISYLLLLLEIYFIEKMISTKQKRYYIIFLVISALIVNFHASVWYMTIILVLPYLAEAIMHKIMKNKNLEKSKIILEPISIKMLIIAILCLVLGSFISPIGTYTYTYMFKVIGGISSTFISELQQTDIISSIGMILGLIVIDILMLATKSKMKLSDILLFFGLYFMAILARRNQAFLYLIGTIPVVRLITNFFETYDTENILEKLNNFFSKNWVLGCTTIVIVIGLSSNMVTRIREKYVNERKYPVEAVNFIKENLDYKNLKIYNSFNYGSYLELSGIPAFVDSRSEIFTEEFNNVTILKDWLETSRGNVNYNDTFAKYEIDYAIVEDKEIINTYISADENYEKVFDDETFSIYMKK